MATGIEFTDPILLGGVWLWAHNPSNRIPQWILGPATRDDIIFASIIRTPVPNYRIIVRDRNGLTSMDDTADALDVAMIAAETHILFKLPEISRFLNT